MIPRPFAGTQRTVAALMLATAGLLALAGCDPRTMLYFLQPGEPTIPAPGPSLKEKKVVILTHAIDGTQNDYEGLDHDLAREIAKILDDKKNKITIVNQDKVWDWMEGHPSWSDPAEAAREFDADMAIFLEVEQFEIANPNSPGILYGKSRTHIQAFELAYPTNSKGKPIKDRPKEAKNIYDDYTDTEFPRRGALEEGSRLSRGAFRAKFLKVVAMEIAWAFIGHSPEDDVEDVTFGAR